MQDQSGYLQLGSENEFEFYDYELPPPKPSSWNSYPTKENPDGVFKYGSIEINLSQDLTTWHRQTYSILDFIGDMGGLLDGLWYACAAIIMPFQIFTVNELILTSFFRKNKRIDENIEHNATNIAQDQIKS